MLFIPRLKTTAMFRLPAIKWILLIFMLMPVTPVMAAESYVYISDTLRVGVRKEPQSGLPPIGVVLTGMRLKVLERSDGFMKIETDKGVTGWIKDIYVTEHPPSIIQLKALKKKYQQLEKELATSKDTATMLEKANLALNDQLDDLKSERQQWVRERAELLASQYQESSPVGFIILILLLLLASFIGGIFWYKLRVMKRLGGLRV